MREFRYMLLGCLLGVCSTNIYINLKYTNFAIPKYKVGDCLSNGLYFEKISEIRKRNVFVEALYVTDLYIGGKNRSPDTTPTWIVDETYIQVAEANCTEKK